MQKYGKKGRLLTMLFLTFSFFLAEIITGYITNSMALVADSFHMLSDVLSIIIGYLAVVYSGKKSKRNTYDWKRAEILGAMANAVFLLALVFTIIIEAIQRLTAVEEINNPLLVLGVGSAGLFINLIGLVLFGGHAHGHSHGHDDDDEDHEHSHEDSDHKKRAITDGSSSVSKINDDAKSQNSGKKKQTEKSKQKRKNSQMNMQAVFLHVLGDALGSVVVIVSALIIHFVQDDWRFYVDPVMSLVTSSIISVTTIPLLRRSALILLQNPPRNVNVNEVKEKAEKVPGVVGIHDLHVWQLSGTVVIATVHVILREGSDYSFVARRLKQIFHDVDIHATTIQPEYISILDVVDVKAEEKSENTETKQGAVVLDMQHHPLGDRLPGCQISATNPNGCSGCLISCESTDCVPYMCCDGLRQRTTLTSIDGYANESFTTPL